MQGKNVRWMPFQAIITWTEVFHLHFLNLLTGCEMHRRGYVVYHVDDNDDEKKW